MTTLAKFPKYFLVDHEIYVKVDSIDSKVFATNDLGSPYSPFKAMIVGREICKAEFDKGSTVRRIEYPGV